MLNVLTITPPTLVNAQRPRPIMSLDRRSRTVMGVGALVKYTRESRPGTPLRISADCLKANSSTVTLDKMKDTDKP